MQKIGDITNTADGNGEYTNGNVAAGVTPTLLDAAWFNTIQREMINVISKAGIELNKNNDAQLSEAISQLIAKSKMTLTDSLGKSSELAASQKLTNQVNDNANARLAKNQNGADIENKQRFVYNLGLTDTVDLAVSAIPKSAITQHSGISQDEVMSQYITSQLISERIRKVDAELLAVPIGGILMWCSPVSYPDNFLSMAGGWIDREKYPELLKHYPSGRLPDWRGYVPRGWDNDRGVDSGSGRQLGSFQEDAIRDITGVIRTGSRKTDGIYDNTTGAFSTSGTGGKIAVYGESDRPNAYTYEDREFRASHVVPTATENRMKNVAVIFLIRGR